MSVVAAIDIGTNSTRLLVAKVCEQGTIKVLRAGLKTTRLGEGIRQKILLPGAMERTLLGIKAFLKDIDLFDVENIILAATSAVRDALNQKEFLSMVQKETGQEVVVLPGKEEARLSYLGVISGLNLSSEQVTVIDVGGGSTEFTWATDRGIVFKSFNIGAVRMTLNGDTYEQIFSNLAKNIDFSSLEKVQKLVGVGGTVTTLAAIKFGLEPYDAEIVHGSTLNICEVQQIMQLLEQKNLEERKNIPGLQPERADIIVSGVRIVHSIMTLLKQEKLLISEADILHGLALAAAHIVEIKLDR